MIRLTRTLALSVVLVAALLVPAAAQADFGFEPGSVSTTFETSQGVTRVPQASSHPYGFSINFNVNGSGVGTPEGGQVRNLLIDLPAGFAGNPFAVGRCTRQEFEGSAPQCSPNSQVGILLANLEGLPGSISGPIYNMVPPKGVAAQLGFSAAGLNALQNISVDTGEGLGAEAGTERYGLQVGTFGLPLAALSVHATIWGTPAESSHDDQRGQCLASGQAGCVPTLAYVGSHNAFLTLPADCSKPISTRIAIDSALDPEHYVSQTVESLDASGKPAAPQRCDEVPFSPKLSASTTSTYASSSSGLGFELALPNEGLTNPDGIAETEPEKVEVELPAGLTANASAASGLTACSEEQFKTTTVTDNACPEASKLGTLFARSSLIDEPVEGSVYLATPLHNRFGTLLSLYIIASAPERGVLIKQAGRVDIDQATGRLTTTFDGLPPLPYSSFELKLREGPRAPLTTPLTCGTYQATARLYPFSEPGAARTRTAPFTISSGPEGGGCVSSEAQLPNSPAFEAGTQTPLAGSYSPFVLKLSRNEGSQHFQALNVTLPPGLTGRLAGTSECSDAQIAQAASRSGEGEGALEQSSPSCPADSEIGTVSAGAGSGTPFYVQGRAYLAGPYKGAPLSMVIITPAIAGPFDLGVVAVRAGLYVDEETARITVKSDPLPTSLHGIPLDIRSIAVQVAKSDFTLNPTNCEAKEITAESVSPTGQVAHLQNRFQVGGCKGLEFAPKLSIQLKGSTKHTGHPALKAVVTYPEGGESANIAGAQVNLPRSEFIDQGNLNKTCTRPLLRARACPASSVYGKAKAWTPLLAKPLEGNVYLVGGYGFKLPALVAELNGQIHIVLVGKVDTGPNKGIRNTFSAVPDAPVSRFILEMKGGKKYGLLENSENLCAQPQKGIARFTGQNGKVDTFEPIVQNDCKKKGAGKKGKKSKRAARSIVAVLRANEFAL
jgi:hypothetical protein